MLTEQQQKNNDIFEIYLYISEDIKLHVFETQSKSSTLKPPPVSQVTIMRER